MRTAPGEGVLSDEPCRRGADEDAPQEELGVNEARRFLEPGPIVLVSSRWQGQANIMTMGWHMVMETEPSLIGCYIWSENHSFDMVRKSRESVLNVPAVDLAPKVVRIGNCSGRDVDKFAKFGLTAVAGAKIGAPLIGECFASFECKLIDASLIDDYSLFVLEVVKGHVAPSPKYPRTELSRRRRIHDLGGEYGAVAQAVQAGNAVRHRCNCPTSAHRVAQIEPSRPADLRHPRGPAQGECDEHMASRSGRSAGRGHCRSPGRCEHRQ